MPENVHRGGGDVNVEKYGCEGLGHPPAAATGRAGGYSLQGFTIARQLGAAVAAYAGGSWVAIRSGAMIGQSIARAAGVGLVVAVGAGVGLTVGSAINCR